MIAATIVVIVVTVIISLISFFGGVVTAGKLQESTMLQLSDAQWEVYKTDIDKKRKG